MVTIGSSLKAGLKPRIIASNFIHRQPENMIRSMMIRTQFCLAAMLLSALLLGGCATGMMHDKVNDLPEQKAMYSQETLCYMGLDKDIASEYDCPCMRKYPQSSVLFIKLVYSGKSYTAQPNTDYRVNGMTAMNTPINVVQYRHSKFYTAAKAAAVLATPFAAAVDVITLPIQAPVFIDGFSKVRH